MGCVKFFPHKRTQRNLPDKSTRKKTNENNIGKKIPKRKTATVIYT